MWPCQSERSAACNFGAVVALEADADAAPDSCVGTEAAVAATARPNATLQASDRDFISDSSCVPPTAAYHMMSASSH